MGPQSLCLSPHGQALSSCRGSLKSIFTSVHSLAMPSGFSLTDALQRLADEDHLALLDSGSCADGGSYLTWGQAPRILHSIDELNVNQGSAQLHPSGSWPHSMHGGALIQIDYGFPVGVWSRASAQAQARLWSLDYYLSWHGERCQIWAQSAAEAEQLRSDLLKRSALVIQTAALNHAIQGSWDQVQHQQRLERIHQYIRQGDIYQVNLTMPFEAELGTEPHQDLAIYNTLRQQSPAPYSAFFRDKHNSIMSHSPERFLSCDGQRCYSNPIKGTNKRIVGKEAAQRQALEQSEKDHAELAMIIDLVRNDLGRIAKSGSVNVDEHRAIMDLPYVHHAYGKISCALKDGVQHKDLFAAAFPAGSITGAPKIRAMHIIEELEAKPRYAYCGSFGWLGANAACELAVAIRTMQVTDKQLRFDAGGGIVIDSDAHAEWQELNDKASAMRQSLMGDES